ncbi:hypothetical protein [Leclercia adecarboxylata]|uniref:hypothetical protein n=1 Tax=Leclercia adecarboxylata TaxID=83655 RepID=UPI0021E76FB7|nr:hypothetical protein [Leclercia adecarboxylata]MCV3303698.1 hypothetical protein [Leclercia adecarboxylata]MCV3306429.1 hypothetical protein [Leclercia adecarboxylata]
MVKNYLKSALTVVFLLATGSSSAVTLYTFDCPDRENIVLEKAPYRLNTLGWDDEFYVGTGVKKVSLEDGTSLHVMKFVNGDRLIYDNNFRDVYMIYATTNKIRACSMQSSATVEPTDLPYVKRQSPVMG